MKKENKYNDLYQEQILTKSGFFHKITLVENLLGEKFVFLVTGVRKKIWYVIPYEDINLFLETVQAVAQHKPNENA